MPNSAKERETERERERERERGGGEGGGGREREGCFCPPFVLDSPPEASHQKRPQPKVLSRHYLPATTIKNTLNAAVAAMDPLCRFAVPARDSGGVRRDPCLVVWRDTKHSLSASILLHWWTGPLPPPPPPPPSSPRLPVKPSHHKRADPVGHPQRLPTRHQGPPAFVWGFCSPADWRWIVVWTVHGLAKPFCQTLYWSLRHRAAATDAAILRGFSYVRGSLVTIG